MSDIITESVLRFHADLVFFSGVFCRRRNKELLQEDGLRVGGTVYGEGPVRTWNGLNLDCFYLDSVFFFIIYQGHILWIQFLK